MGTAKVEGRILRATLCEIERGVFYASYPDRGSDTEGLVIYQTGTSAAEAKLRIELNAQALGYETVVWKQTIIAPLFASSGETQARYPSTSTGVDRLGMSAGL